MTSEHFHNVEHDHHICKRCRAGPLPELDNGLCGECIWTDQTYGQDQMEE